MSGSTLSSPAESACSAVGHMNGASHENSMVLSDVMVSSAGILM